MFVAVVHLAEEAVFGLDPQAVWRHKLDFVAKNDIISRKEKKIRILSYLLFPLNVFCFHHTVNIQVNFLLNN